MAYSIKNVLVYVTELDSEGHFTLVFIRAASLWPGIHISANDTGI
jgi:hypothetical protein